MRDAGIAADDAAGGADDRREIDERRASRDDVRRRNRGERGERVRAFAISGSARYHDRRPATAQRLRDVRVTFDGPATRLARRSRVNDDRARETQSDRRARGEYVEIRIVDGDAGGA